MSSTGELCRLMGDWLLAGCPLAAQIGAGSPAEAWDGTGSVSAARHANAVPAGPVVYVEERSRRYLMALVSAPKLYISANST